MTDESAISGLLKKREELQRESASLREQMAIVANSIDAIDRVLEAFGFDGELEGKSPRAARVILPATSRHRALPSLAVRQRGRSSPNGALRLPLPRQKDAIPDTETGNRPASRSPNPANPQSIFASSPPQPVHADP